MISKAFPQTKSKKGTNKGATEGPAITLKELQSSVAVTGVKVNQSVISRPLHTSGLCVRL